MRYRLGLFAFTLCVFCSTSCERVRIQQYTAPPPTRAKNDPPKPADEFLYRLSWVEPRERHGLPIVFVANSSDEWQRLPTYWNQPVKPYAGMRTIHLGLPPLQALAALVLTEHHEAIKIKVPLGLPDPTANVPATNLLTHGKWLLGQRLFFDSVTFKAGNEFYSCASCHKPALGFADISRRSFGGSFNTLSLVNVVYNRRQFWDGRVETLEEVLVRGLDDEGPIDQTQSREKALKHHVWTGFVKTLVDNKRYNRDFNRVFGVEHPTQDTVAKALATYMRTILSGDSLFDRADALRTRKTDALTAAHFAQALDDKTAQSLHDDHYSRQPKRAEMPAMLAKGYELFHDKALCAKCHQGPLFTDRDYHNVGYSALDGLSPDDDEGLPPLGKETGRAVHVPIGHKESRLIGAFRTPSLRNVARTSPYFHNGAHGSLRKVVEFYNENVTPTSHLARVLKDGNAERRLRLEAEEVDALVIFLRSLDGRPVDPIVTTAP